MMTLEERCFFWKTWEERTRELWRDIDWATWSDFKSYGMPDDIEVPVMEELFNMAVKMHELVSERREIVEKVYNAVDEKRNELRKKFNLDEYSLPESENINYKALQEAI